MSPCNEPLNFPLHFRDSYVVDNRFQSQAKHSSPGDGVQIAMATDGTLNFNGPRSCNPPELASGHSLGTQLYSRSEGFSSSA